MATHNAGWVIGVVDGAIESASSPNASVLRLRTQVGTEPNGAPRLVTIPMTIWDNTLDRVRAVARPGAMVLTTFTISAERLGAGLGVVPVVRVSGVSAINVPDAATVLADSAGGGDGGSGNSSGSGNSGALVTVATPPSSPAKRQAH